MTSSTINNGRLSRKTLSSQIDRLDAVLDGLAENLNGAVAMTVKEVVGQVVREAVEVAVKEVLANPELLRAALAQHVSPVAQPAANPQGSPVKSALKGAWNWLCKKVAQTTTQAKKKLGQGLTWGLEKLKKGCAALSNGCQDCVSRCAQTAGTLGAVGLTLWRFRRASSIALTSGLVGACIGYFAGPMISAMLCALGSMTMTLSGMFLLPLWRLLQAQHA